MNSFGMRLVAPVLALAGSSFAQNVFEVWPGGPAFASRCGVPQPAWGEVLTRVDRMHFRGVGGLDGGCEIHGMRVSSLDVEAASQEWFSLVARRDGPGGMPDSTPDSAELTSVGAPVGVRARRLPGVEPHVGLIVAAPVLALGADLGGAADTPRRLPSPSFGAVGLAPDVCRRGDGLVFRVADRGAAGGTAHLFVASRFGPPSRLAGLHGGLWLGSEGFTWVWSEHVSAAGVSLIRPPFLALGRVPCVTATLPFQAVTLSKSERTLRATNAVATSLR